MCKSIMILLPYIRCKNEVQGSDRLSPGKLVADFQPFCVLSGHGVNDTDKCLITCEESVTACKKISFQPSLTHMLTEHTVHDTSVSCKTVISVMKISATSDYYIGGKNITLMKNGVYNNAITINGNRIDLNSDNIDIYPTLINTLKLTSKSVVYLSVKKVSGACRIQLSLSKNVYGGKIGNGIDISSNTYKEYVGTKGFSNDATACFVYSNQNKKAHRFTHVSHRKTVCF